MDTKQRHDVLAVIFARIENYPSSQIQIELLREAGLKVAVIEQRSRSKNKFLTFISYFRFRARVSQFIKKEQPAVVIAYDTFGMQLTGKPWKYAAAPKVIWHFHELLQILENSDRTHGRMVKRAEEFIVKNIKKVDALTFPDQARADYFVEKTQANQEIFTVMNCPRLRRVEASAPLDAFKKTHQIPNDAAVIYFHGALAKSRCLDRVIQSMPQWQVESHLVMIGPVEPAYLQELNALTDSLNLTKRVHYSPPLSYEAVLALAAGADIGISIVGQNNSPLWRFSAGAVNKRFEYMSVGLPQITDNGVGVADIINGPACGLLLDTLTPQAISEAVNKLLTQKDETAEMRLNALKKHQETYHYEKQFTALKQQIINWVKQAS